MEELPENIADAPEIEIPSATKSQKPKRKSPGRPFTKENAKTMQLSAAKAKAMRKEARAKMLSALTNDLDLGKELLKAMKGKDEKYLGMIEKATRLVGLQHDQSEDAVGQKISLNAKTDANLNAKVELPSINITFEDAKPKEQ
jgi:hypothetical protein